MFGNRIVKKCYINPSLSMIELSSLEILLTPGTPPPQTMITVNDLNLRTISSFCSQIKCWLSGLEFTKCLPQ